MHLHTADHGRVIAPTAMETCVWNHGSPVNSFWSSQCKLLVYHKIVSHVNKMSYPSFLILTS